MTLQTTRRAVLGGLFAGLTWPWIGSISGARAASPPHPVDDLETATDLLLHAFPRRGSAERIGRAILDGSHAKLQTGRVVEELLASAPDLRRAVRAGSAPAVRRALAARCRRDFAEDAVVEVSGWVMATTEVRICTLASLAISPSHD